MQSSFAGIRWLRPAIARVVAPLVLGLGSSIGCISGEDAASTSTADAAAPDACSPHISSGMLPANVSFRADVMPLFTQSCTLFRYCHNNDGRQANLFLGPNPLDPDYPPTETTFAEVRAALINAAAVRAVSMVRVSPGSPENSFLVHKVDTDQNCSDILCKHPLSGMTGTDLCGDKMPPGNSVPLDVARADVIRAWIQDGALDN